MPLIVSLLPERRQQNDPPILREPVGDSSCRASERESQFEDILAEASGNGIRAVEPSASNRSMITTMRSQSSWLKVSSQASISSCNSISATPHHRIHGIIAQLRYCPWLFAKHAAGDLAHLDTLESSPGPNPALLCHWSRTPRPT